MRLKSFYAKTMTEAMQMVRDMLGEDAIIVATKEENGGKAVRVTAAIEEDLQGYNEFDVHGDLPPEEEEWADGGWLLEEDDADESAIIEDLTDAMIRHGVPEDVTDQIISCATIVGLENSSVALVAALEHLFNFQPISIKPAKKPIMVVGPPGAGKTLAVAKLATRSVMNGLSVGMISTDTVRAGGIEQLQAFTKLLRLDLHKANTPEQLDMVLKRMRGMDQIIIDTAGLNPFDQSDIKQAARWIGDGAVDPVLVLPAGLDPDESGEIARSFSRVGVTRLLSTRLDIARRMGGLLCAAHQGGMSFADASSTPKVADGLTAMTPNKIAALLLPHARGQKSGQTDTPPSHAQRPRKAGTVQ